MIQSFKYGEKNQNPKFQIITCFGSTVKMTKGVTYVTTADADQSVRRADTALGL